MLNRLNDLSVKGYLKVKSFFRDLNNDERGLSGVVVAVLLILVAVLAIVLIWGALSGWLKELWDKITGAAVDIDKGNIGSGTFGG